MSDVLKILLKQVYKVSDEKLAEILEISDAKDQADAILNLDKERVLKFKEAETKAFDKGHQKAKGETLADFEKGIREKYGIADDALQGEALIEAAVTNAVEKAVGKKGSNLSDDAVKAHPLYVQLQEDHKKALKAADTEWKNKYDQREAEYGKTERHGKAIKEANTRLDSLNPILPKSATVASTIKNGFEKEVKEYDYDFQDGVIVVKTADGKVLEDQHGNRVSFDDHINGIASKYFEFAESTDRGNGGNSNDGGNQGGNGGNTGGKTINGHAIPKNEDELAAILDNREISSADKTALNQAFLASQKAPA